MRCPDFKKLSLICAFGFFLIRTGHAQEALYINEFLASNVSAIQSPITGEYSDWIEIYNAGTSGINIKGYYLSDDPQHPDKWKILAERLINPGGYGLFWADGYDKFIQTNFKLKRSDGFIGLYDNNLSVLDTISYGYQEDNISYGRSPQNLNDWVYFSILTPGEPNPATFYASKTPDPGFSLPGGFYSGPQSLQIIIHDPDITIRYTLDGNTPGLSDSIFPGTLNIDSTTALRIRAYKNGMLPGNVLTRTYFINEPVNLPFISLVTDPANFFSDSTGIYVIGTQGVDGYCNPVPMNLNMDWERPVNVELYDTDGSMELNQMAGVKIFGGCSRTRYPEKSLALYARSDYGKGSFDCQLFKDKPIHHFESFILRSSADDCVYTMFKDGMAQTLLNTTDIDRQAYRPVVSFINGKYWGIINIREKITEHYVAENYGMDASGVNLLKRDPSDPWNVISGDAYPYNSFVSHVSMYDLSGQSGYDYIASQIDVNNYLDYMSAEIYLSANDWPGNNIKFWSANKGPWNKWRWIIYDLDNCFWNTDWNTLDLATKTNCLCDWPNPPWSTLLFRKLLGNEIFRDQFIQRIAWHMNTTLLSARVIHVIDSIRSLIAPEIPRHIQRWGGQKVPFPESWIQPTFNSVEEWEGNIEYMRRFARERRAFVTQHVIDYFGLRQGMMNLTVRMQQPGAGMVKINGEVIPGGMHQGSYFLDVPLEIKAIAAPGYRFSYWSYTPAGAATQSLYNQVLTVTPNLDLVLVPHFDQDGGNKNSLVINEINYHSATDPDPKDWVELYNTKNEIVDLTGWTLSDENDSHIFQFPKGLEIGPGGYLVICEDITSFSEVFPEITNRTGDLGFGLSNGGELIRLFAPHRVLVDSVRYDDKKPWPEAADGTGPTLELIDPGLNNDLASSWTASFENGTPGRQNFSNKIISNTLGQNFPNPFGPSTSIPYTLNTPGWVCIRIYDSFGNEISTLVNENKEAARYLVNWESAGMPSGMYLCAMFVDQKLKDTKKMLVIH